MRRITTQTNALGRARSAHHARAHPRTAARAHHTSTDVYHTILCGVRASSTRHPHICIKHVRRVVAPSRLVAAALICFILIQAAHGLYAPTMLVLDGGCLGGSPGIVVAATILVVPPIHTNTLLPAGFLCIGWPRRQSCADAQMVAQPLQCCYQMW